METRFKLGALALAASVAVTAIIAACSNDSKDSTSPPPPPPPTTTNYIAQMSSANEVPAVAGTATGTAMFTLTGKTLSYVVTVNGLSGNAVASHIHLGGANVNGGILFPFNAAA